MGSEARDARISATSICRCSKCFESALRLEARAESFNLTNTPNFAHPSARIGTASCGTSVDTLVNDIQDVGARFYTYSCTMIYSLQEAARFHLPFYVLDRPNPITGNHVGGPIVDPDLESYVGCSAVPVRHGFTFGELAQFVNGEQHLSADLHVIKMEGSKRSDWWDDTNLTWIDLSPNMNSLPAALLYPGICLLESTKNFSVGRGTRVAYERIGTDKLDGASTRRVPECPSHSRSPCLPDTLPALGPDD